MPGDIVVFDREKISEDERPANVEEMFWRAEVTGKTGRSDNFRWLYDDKEYSATGLAKAVFSNLTSEDPSGLNGNKPLQHPEFNDRTLSDLRNSRERTPERRKAPQFEEKGI